jgi:hypothetical protein
MSHFHKYPGPERISRQILNVTGDSITVGLWGYKDNSGAELIVTNEGDDLNIQQTGVFGNSSVWKISVRQSARVHKGRVKDRIIALTSKWETWDHFDVDFNYKIANATTTEVRPITADLFGPPSTIWRRSSVPEIHVVTNGQLLPGQSAPVLQFDRSVPKKPVDFAVFAAKRGAVQRAFILVKQPETHPRNLLVVVPHPFAQGRGVTYYGDLGFFKDPLSLDLIRNVIDRFALARWGSQLFAASSNHALLMPVPSGVGQGGEMGPFITDRGVGAEIIVKILGASNGAFSLDSVELCCFSGGVHQANTFVASGGRGLNITFGCNQDPQGGAALAASIPVRRQYLSGYTTGGPRHGFIYLPDPPCWSRDPLYAQRKTELGGEYKHTWAIPHHTLYMALTSK